MTAAGVESVSTTIYIDNKYGQQGVALENIYRSVDLENIPGRQYLGIESYVHHPHVANSASSPSLLSSLDINLSIVLKLLLGHVKRLFKLYFFCKSTATAVQPIERSSR